MLFDEHACVSLFEEADDLLIGKSGLFLGRYSPKLADFVPSLWYDREGAGQSKSAQGIPIRNLLFLC
jgi:hypothetical protein